MNKSEQLLAVLKRLILEEQRCLSSKEVMAITKELEKLIVDDVRQITFNSKVS